MINQCKNDQQCQKQFDVLFAKLDKLDQSIRGNGKPGIMVRLDRLEQSSRLTGRFFWLVTGALITAITAWVIS